MKVITCSAPVNIAIIKYWGKRDEALILPLNDSISFTLSQDDMCAKTSIAASPNYTQDRFWLNGKEECLDHPRIQNCIQEIRRRSSQHKADNSSNDILNWHVHICSENNFPTAAGLASSAAGYACLVYTLAQLYNIEGDLSTIARLGSGSACRSMSGGLVRWYKGIKEDGSDSVAKQLSPPEQWPNLHVIICVVCDERKKTGSTVGMQRTVKTSKLFKHRITETVDTHINELVEALKNNDWSSVCDIVMSDSNQMHSCCLDTFPPCVYMNDTSHYIANVVHSFNLVKTQYQLGQEKICYTFDAGPNACIFVPNDCLKEVVSALVEVFPPDPLSISLNEYIKGEAVPKVPLSEKLKKELSGFEKRKGYLKYMIHTKVGDGPRLLSDKQEQDQHLLDLNTGIPLTLNRI